MNRLQSAGRSIVELNGIGRITADYGGAGGMHDYRLVANGDRDRTCGRIDGGGEAIDAALLPILQFLLMTRFKIGVLYGDDFCGNQRMGIVRGNASDSDTIADLKILQGNSCGIAQSFGSGVNAKNLCGGLHDNADFGSRVRRQTDSGSTYRFDSPDRLIGGGRIG